MIKEQLIAGGILLTLESATLPDEILNPIKEKWCIEEDDDDFEEMVTKAAAITDACAFLRVEQVTSVDGDCVLLGTQPFVSSLVAQKLHTPGMTAVGYVATCGRALYEARNEYADDFIAVLIWDQISEAYLRMARDMMQKYVMEKIFPNEDNKKMFSSLNPGSLEAWPIRAQKDLFAFLGEGATLAGVELTDSMLMLPTKTTSGIYFPTDKPYENCIHCPRINCPGRRAPFESEH